MDKKKNIRHFNSLQGFTLIELLIVIAIIGVLAAGIISIINPVAQFQKVRDARRKSDLSQIQKALEVYINDIGSYPLSSENYRIEGPDGAPIAWGTSWQPYMETLPKDPISSKNYVYVGNGQTYYLYANLNRGGNDPQACKPDGSPCDSAVINGVATACGGNCNYELAMSGSGQNPIGVPISIPPLNPTSTPAPPTSTPTPTPTPINKWTQKANFGGVGRYLAVGFSIGNKGYIGIGQRGWVPKDFWEYDPSTNVWTQKADFGGAERIGAVGFSIGNKGYIGTGYSPPRNDFWEYDPSTNTWTRKADFGGVGRWRAVGFSIGNKGYIGTGMNASNSYLKDFWEYDPSTNVWTQKADFGGVGRIGAVGFSIGNKGYIGTGDNSSWKDFWEYDPTTNVWTQKADFGGVGRYFAVGFSIGNKGYIGTGYGSSYYKDFWEYDPSTNTWTRKADFGGAERIGAVGFSIGNKGYIGTGDNNFSLSFGNDFWEYSP